VKHWLCLFLLVSAEAFAVAPDSVAGKVFREFGAVPRVGAYWESTIVLGSDGRYIYLKYGDMNVKFGIGSAPNLTRPYTIFIQDPPKDGTYTYVRTGESTGTLELTDDSGAKQSYALPFSSLSAGVDLPSGPLPSSREFYFTDLTAMQSAPVTNVFVRGQVSPGHPLIVGLVIPGTQEREVLIRAVGPSLAPFGVSGVWADPDFQLYQGTIPANPKEVHYGDWSVQPFSGGLPSAVAGFQKIFNYLGAFPLLAGSKDAADVVRLAAGIYTIVASTGAGDTGGEALLEVYPLP